MRDRLIEMMKMYPCMSTADMDIVDKSKQIFIEIIAEDLADYLLANGVIVPPCKVGDKMYKIFTKYTPFVGEYVVEDYGIPTRDVLGHYLIIPFDEIGKTVFLSREEAVEALKRKEDESNAWTHT